MAPIDIQIQDTYYVVAHFHYVLVAGSLYALFAGGTTGARKWTGVMYPRRAARSTSGAALIFFNVTFFPMHFLGLAGMPRRYADYPMQFADFNMPSRRSAFGFGLMQVYFFLFVVLPMMRGQGKAPQNPGRRRGPGVEAPSPAPVPHLRDAAASWMPPPHHLGGRLTLSRPQPWTRQGLDAERKANQGAWA